MSEFPRIELIPDGPPDPEVRKDGEEDSGHPEPDDGASLPAFPPHDVVAATPELEGEVAGIRLTGSPSDEPAADRSSGISLGIRYMAAGAFFFSLMSLLVKIAGQRLPSQEVVLVRAVVTLVLSYWGVRRVRVSPWGNDRRLLVTRGMVGFVGLSGFYYAVVHLPLSDATVIQYTNPVFATIIAIWVLREPLRLREVLSVLVSLVGVVVVTRPGFLAGFGSGAPLSGLAVGIGLFGALGSGAAYVAVRKLRATEHPLVIVFYFALISVIASAPLGLFNAIRPTPREWLVLLGVGIMTQLGQVCITKGLHLETAGRATGIGYLQIVFATVWGALFFGEFPDAVTVLGAALIVAGTLMLARQARPSRA